MQKNKIYTLLIIIVTLLSCSSDDEVQEDSFEDVEEFILCSVIQFTEDLDSCYSVSISSSMGTENYERCNGEPFNFCLSVPAQELITLEIEYVDDCGFPQSYTEVHGPFTFDPSLEDVIITVDNSINNSLFSINGTLLNCDNNVVSNGAAILNISGKQIINYVNNGEFEFDELNCLETGSSFTIQTIDFNTNLISDVLTFSLTTNDMELGSINVCNPLYEFITYQISDHPIITYQNVDFNAGNTGDYKIISYNGTNDDDSFDLRWYEGFQFSLSDSNGDISDAAFDPEISLTEHSIGQVGDFMIVSFTGRTVYYDETVRRNSIEGIICVLRDY